jgi:hypothetical protein
VLTSEEDSRDENGKEGEDEFGVLEERAGE